MKDGREMRQRKEQRTEREESKEEKRVVLRFEKTCKTSPFQASYQVPGPFEAWDWIYFGCLH